MSKCYYAWPASQLDVQTMSLLYNKREELKKTGVRKPITLLLKEAVKRMLENQEDKTTSS